MSSECDQLSSSCDYHMIIVHCNMQLHNAKDILRKLESVSAEQAGKSCLESCLDAVVIALSLVCVWVLLCSL